MYISLHDGTKLRVNWIAVGSRDPDTLRIRFPSGNLKRIVDIFTDPNSFPISEYCEDEFQRTYDRFTVLKRAAQEEDGGIILSLRKD